MNIFLPLGPEDSKFSLFSIEHIIMLILLISINVFIILFLIRKNSDRTNNIFRFSLALFIILLEVVGHYWKIYFDKWAVNTSLPLHLCGISAYTSALMLIIRKYLLFELVYFWGLGGALIAIITPNLDYNMPHLMFFKFFFAHNAIILSVLYMTFVEKYKPSLKSVLKIFFITNIYMIFVGIINYLINANYLYICRKPDGTTMLDFSGPWPYYIISMEIAALLIFFLLYFPFKLTGKQNIRYKG